MKQSSSSLRHARYRRINTWPQELQRPELERIVVHYLLLQHLQQLPPSAPRRVAIIISWIHYSARKVSHVILPKSLGVRPNKSFNAFAAENQRRKKVAAALFKSWFFSCRQLQLELRFKETEEKSRTYQLLPLLKFYWVCECSNAAKFPAFKIDLLVLQQTQNKANYIVVLLTPPFLISLNGTTFLWMHSLYSENPINWQHCVRLGKKLINHLFYDKRFKVTRVFCR